MSSDGYENLDVEESSVVTDGFDSLKIAWETKVRKEFLIDSKLKSKCRSWKTSEEISELLASIKVRNDFEDAKSKREEKIKRKYSKKDYPDFPEDLQRLRTIAQKRGGYGYKKKKWRLVVDKDDGSHVLYKGSDIKPTENINEFHRMLPIDGSYDFLMKLHCEMDHVGPTAFANYLHVNKIGCLPRKLVGQFHNFCEKCVKRNVDRKLRKLEKKENNKAKSDEVGFLVLSTVIFDCLDVEDEKLTFLYGLFTNSHYVICSPLKNNYHMSSYVAALMNTLLQVGCPRNIYLINCSDDDKGEVSLLDQNLNLIDHFQNLVEQNLNSHEHFQSNSTIVCQLDEGLV